MSHAGVEDTIILKEILPDSLEGLKILDCGFGYGWWGLKLRTQKKGESYIIGVDSFKPYVETQLNMGIYDEVYHIDVLDISTDIIPDCLFDIIIASHIIEHLEKEDGYKMIDILENICGNLLIIACPRGFTVSGAVDDNEDNRHRSAWFEGDFKKLGYSTKIVNTEISSRAVNIFANFYYRLRGKTPPNRQHIIAWKFNPKP